MINHRFSLENALQLILHRIDDWINEGSGWIVELIESTYRSLSESFYVKLLAELRNSKKGLINIKKTHHKCFF